MTHHNASDSAPEAAAAKTPAEYTLPEQLQKYQGLIQFPTALPHREWANRNVMTLAARIVRGDHEAGPARRVLDIMLGMEPAELNESLQENYESWKCWKSFQPD